MQSHRLVRSNSTLKQLDYLDLSDSYIRSDKVVPLTIDKSAQTLVNLQDYYKSVETQTIVDNCKKGLNDIEKVNSNIMEEENGKNILNETKIDDDEKKELVNGDNTSETDCDKEVENGLKVNSELHNCNDSNISTPRKVPPQRPPPPRLSSANTMSKEQQRVHQKAYQKMKRNFTLTEKFYIFKSNTSDFTKKLKKHEVFRSHSIEKKSKHDNRKPCRYCNKRCCICQIQSPTLPKKSPSLSEPGDHSITKKKVAHHETLSRTYSFMKRLTMSDLISGNESIFDVFTVMQDLKEVVMTEPDNVFDLKDFATGFLLLQSSTAFLNSGRHQMFDRINQINDSMSQYLDLDGQSLLFACQKYRGTQHGCNEEIEPYTMRRRPLCCQEDLYNISWLQGWNHIRIVEENHTGKRYIILKNACSSWWVYLCGSKVIRLSRRWFSFPILIMNSLDNELKNIENLKANNIDDRIVLLYKNMVRLILLLSLSNFYAKDHEFSRKLDLSKIILVASHCGFITIFHEDFDKSETTEISTDWLESESLSDVPQELESLKQQFFEQIQRLFTDIEVIRMFISSVWPFDALLYVLVENVLGSAIEEGKLCVQPDSSDESDDF